MRNCLSGTGEAGDWLESMGAILGFGITRMRSLAIYLPETLRGRAHALATQIRLRSVEQSSTKSTSFSKGLPACDVLCARSNGRGWWSCSEILVDHNPRLAGLGTGDR